MNTVLLRVGKTPIYRGLSEGSILYVAGMAVDADGGFHAYHPTQGGLDYLANAGRPGNWWGLVTDNGRADGEPLVQGEGDPAPGYHISCTSLADRGRPRRDPRRYVNSEEVPYIALPPEVTRGLGMRLGDHAVVHNTLSGEFAHAIFADGGPRGHIGEGSIALARAMGLPESPRRGGTDKSVIAYLVLKGSAGSWPCTAEDLRARGEELFSAAGGLGALQEHLDEIGTSRSTDDATPPEPGTRVRPSYFDLFGEAEPD